MKQLIALLTFLLAIPGLAVAKEYGTYDPRKIPIVEQTEQGKRYALDLAYLDQIIRDLSSHALNYPPKFDSEADKARAVEDVITISAMLEHTVGEPGA